MGCTIQGGVSLFCKTGVGSLRIFANLIKIGQGESHKKLIGQGEAWKFTWIYKISFRFPWNFHKISEISLKFKISLSFLKIPKFVEIFQIFEESWPEKP